MDFCQASCEDKPSPASDHAVSSSRAELLTRTIAETNMAQWALGRPGQLQQKPWVILISQAACGDEYFRGNCSVH